MPPGVRGTVVPPQGEGFGFALGQIALCRRPGRSPMRGKSVPWGETAGAQSAPLRGRNPEPAARPLAALRALNQRADAHIRPYGSLTLDS